LFRGGEAFRKKKKKKEEKKGIVFIAVRVTHSATFVVPNDDAD